MKLYTIVASFGSQPGGDGGQSDGAGGHLDDADGQLDDAVGQLGGAGGQLSDAGGQLGGAGGHYSIQESTEPLPVHRIEHEDLPEKLVLIHSCLLLLLKSLSQLLQRSLCC